MSKIMLPIECSDCGKEMTFTTDVNPLGLAPKLRCDIDPCDVVFQYRVTSDQIKKYIIKKALQYAPEASIQVSVSYCEKKRKAGEPHRSYAFFKIGFSDHVIQGSKEHGWYSKIGETSSRPRIIQELFEHFIRLFKFDKKVINEWLNSYKKLEKLENGLGMDEAFINEMRMFADPASIEVPGPNGSKEIWVFFAICPEKILQDMFSEINLDAKAKEKVETDEEDQNEDNKSKDKAKTKVKIEELPKVPGKLQVVDIYPISKESVEYIINLYPNAVDTKENPHVKQILQGNEKIKK